MAASMPSSSSQERLDAEIDLLQAMYPDTLTFNTHTREVHYKSTSTSPASSTSTCSSATATLVLRIPSHYPDTGLPELISASDGSKNDVRDRTRRALASSPLALEEGVEVLDQIITVFEDVVASSCSSSSSSNQANASGSATSTSTTTATNDNHGGDSLGRRQAATKTVIIWLHHLLATSKRKLAVTPTTTTTMHAFQGHGTPAASVSISISGLTKPGSPGIMLFSGPRELVDAHVQELKALNWQAFQVRYDSDEEQEHTASSSSSTSEWAFTHEKGKIIEVESMADLVRGIAHEQDKQTFLRVVGVK